MAEQVVTYWPQILGILMVVVMFVKLKSAVAELRKDVDDIHKRRYVYTSCKTKSRFRRFEKQYRRKNKIFVFFME